jgi:fused signal recognition particle receptor
MFGWGKKKQAEAVLEQQTPATPAPQSAAPLPDLVPAAVYVAIADDGPGGAEALRAEIEAAASGVTGCRGTQVVVEGAAVAVTLLSGRDEDGELLFVLARAGGLPLAGVLDGRAKLFVVRSDPRGVALETYRIEPPLPEAPPQAEDVIDRMVSGLARTSSRLAEGVAAVLTRRKLDDETLDDLEELLVTSDIGARAAGRLRAALAKDRFGKDVSEDEVRGALADGIEEILAPYETHDSPFERAPGQPGPRVILFVGVNGSGKTTTIGKVAHNLVAGGFKVMLAAGDTFRAAAVEQLKVWGERAGVPVVARDTGADAAGLAFDALTRARDEGMDVLLIDTAGRLQNKAELMAELAKVVRVLGKLDPDAPHETWLVLDATVGQNALSQAEAFRATAGVTGLLMTKLDGTAKGGVLVAVTEAHWRAGRGPAAVLGKGLRTGTCRPVEPATSRLRPVEPALPPPVRGPVEAS